MAMMVERAKKHKSSIDLLWQFIALSNNEHEIKQAKKLAKNIDIPIFIKTFAESVPDLTPKNPKLRRKLHVKPCTDIYRATFVYYTGEVVVCCYDLEGQYVVGDLKEQSLIEVWNSKEYKTMRTRINNADQNPDEEPEICKNCLKWVNKDYLPQTVSLVDSDKRLTSDLNGADGIV